MPYKNTNHETGETLKQSKEKALRQEDYIYWYIALFPYKLFTPFDIQKLIMPDVPITSIRRAMTCLAAIGLLIKTDVMKLGLYGKMNHCWKLAA